MASSYARRSDPNDLAIEAQHRLNAERALRDGFFIPDDPAFRFEDDGVTGARESRPALDFLLKAVSAGTHKFSRVYVRGFDRLSRAFDFTHCIRLYGLLRDDGVGLCISMREPESLLDYDIRNDPYAYLKLMQDIQASFQASSELIVTRERTTRGTRDIIERGFYPGAPPFGTTRYLADVHTGEFVQDAPAKGRLHLRGAANKLAWDSNLLPWVQYIFNEIQGGRSLAEVAAHLNASKVPTPFAERLNREGKPRWTARRVLSVASNPLYTGTLKWGRLAHPGDAGKDSSDSMRVGDHAVLKKNFISDPPVSESQFALVQAALRRRAKKHGPVDRLATESFTLSGRIHCANCGVPFAGFNGVKRKGTNRGRRYYRHGRSRAGQQGPCPHQYRYFPVEIIEPRVLAVLQQALNTASVESAVHQAIAQQLASARRRGSQGATRRLQQERAELKDQLLRAAELLTEQNSAEAREAFSKVKQRVEQKLADVESRLEGLSHAARTLESLELRVDDIAAQRSRVGELLGTMDVRKRRRLIDQVVHSMTLEPSIRRLTIRVRALG